jgi:hypothetical protein
MFTPTLLTAVLVFFHLAPPIHKVESDWSAGIMNAQRHRIHTDLCIYCPAAALHLSDCKFATHGRKSSPHTKREQEIASLHCIVKCG